MCVCGLEKKNIYERGTIEWTDPRIEIFSMDYCNKHTHINLVYTIMYVLVGRITHKKYIS